MREEHIVGRCEHLSKEMGTSEITDKFTKEILNEAYSRCANCPLRFYHGMKIPDDVLVNFGNKYDTRGMKILKLLNIMWGNCNKIKEKKLFGSMKVFKGAQSYDSTE